MISINNIRKTYGQQVVLDEVNLDFTKGQSIALIGPNGSGKTTLIKCVLGLTFPDSGEIKVLNMPVDKSPEYRRVIGYMPQLNQFPPQMRVRQLFDLIREMRFDVKPEDYDNSLYQKFDIDRMKNKALGTLSGGMKQQVSASLAFFFDPEIILLDEPTAGLDPISNELLKAKINKEIAKDRLIITTSHVLSDLDEISNHVVYLMQGKVRFSESLDSMAQRTGEQRLNKMIVKLLKE